MKTSKSFNQEYIEKAKTLIHEILEDKKEYDDWTQICFSMQNAVQAAANIWGISSDEQINKMRAFITEMVLIELSNLKQFDIVFKKKGIRSLDTLYCPKCGSNNVEERAWVNPNTDEISYNDSVEEEDCWCGICEEHVELCTLSELCASLDEFLSNVEHLYTRYKHSIPSTMSECKNRKYFKALSDKDLEDEDMLFGVGRDIAQVELELYILCQIILGIGWDANKMGKWFWQSNKDRDLVILKNWVTVEK